MLPFDDSRRYPGYEVAETEVREVEIVDTGELALCDIE